jgi:hypothetical protein
MNKAEESKGGNAQKRRGLCFIPPANGGHAPANRSNQLGKAGAFGGISADWRPRLQTVPQGCRVVASVSSGSRSTSETLARVHESLRGITASLQRIHRQQKQSGQC